MDAFFKFILHTFLQAVYNYGVSALEIGEIKDAITAFHHCISIDPENYRAWNNLAASYVRSNQKARAVQVLNVKMVLFIKIN